MLQFIEQANKHHPTIKFTAEISETETTFLDSNIYKGERFRSTSVLDVRTHFKPIETFQYTHFSSCHPPGVKKGFIKVPMKRKLSLGSYKIYPFKHAISKFEIAEVKIADIVSAQG